jgi:hypothetical protein
MRTIRALLVTDMDGCRVASRHYAPVPRPNKHQLSAALPSDPQVDALEKRDEQKSRKELEKVVWQMCRKGREEVIFVDGSVCLAASFSDVRFFVVGNPDANEVRHQ